MQHLHQSTATTPTTAITTTTTSAYTSLCESVQAIAKTYVRVAATGVVFQKKLGSGERNFGSRAEKTRFHSVSGRRDIAVLREVTVRRELEG